MRGLAPALIATLLSTALPSLSGPALAQSCGCPVAETGVTIRSDEAPPPLPDYDQPPLPAPGYMWTPGYWAWNNYEYYWVPGTWVEPPEHGLVWTPGYWAFIDGVYGFHRGYWGSHVGFYGGVDYGYGYGGDGYHGGHWTGDRFFYNRTVNNFGSVRIENVYEKPVSAPARDERASFNGQGGVAAKPTKQEEAIAREKRVPPTKGQISQARAASIRTDSFVSANHGKPAIAATVKPAAFTGPGVVKAKDRGAAPIHPVDQPVGEPNKAAPNAAPSRDVTPKADEKQTPPRGEATPERKLAPGAEPGKGEKRTAPDATATPERKLPPGAEREKGAPRSPDKLEKHVPPNPAPLKAPPAAERPAPKLPPAVERRREDRHEPSQMERGNAPGEEKNLGGRKPPPGAQIGKPPAAQIGNPPAAQIGKPPAPRQAPRDHEKCGGAGEPKCP